MDITQDEYLSPNEVKQLRKACWEAALLPIANEIQIPLRDALIIESALSAGIHVSGLSNLIVEYLYLKKGQKFNRYSTWA